MCDRTDDTRRRALKDVYERRERTDLDKYTNPLSLKTD